MTLAEYRTHTPRTLPDLGGILYGQEIIIPVDIRKKISDKLNYMHMATGLASEVGELVECVGTDLRFDVDLANLGEEIGDLYWYLANYANMRNINLPEELHVHIPEEQCLDFLIIKVGMLVDIIKKFAAYNKDIDRVQETLIVCDVRLALLAIEHTYDLNGKEIRLRNIAKLARRYPVEFSDFLATHRDLVAERKELE
jgi:NTP pyrophosphatase (non-canonical NTP hydrolase)